MSYVRIETGTIEEGKLQCVFGILYCKDATPNKKYQQVSKEIQDLVVPKVLLIDRWDNTVGFPGGKVDEGENLYEALVREMREEIDFNLTDSYKLQPVTTFKDDDVNIHAFAIEVSYAELLYIKDNANKAEHATPEVNGIKLGTILNSEYHEYDNLLENKYCATAKMELEVFVNENNILKVI